MDSRNPRSLLAGMQTSAASLKDSCGSYAANTLSPHEPAITLVIYPEELKTMLTRKPERVCLQQL